MFKAFANILPTSQGEHTWHFCYLHGDAEDVMAYDNEVHGVSEASDLFASDVPMPLEAGNYLVNLFDRPALAVIAPHHGIIAGRVALLSDNEGLRHALDVENWR
mgnify:CR=1 FL=1